MHIFFQHWETQNTNTVKFTCSILQQNQPFFQCKITILSFFLFSFSKYLYKSMAHIQPSFLHFYLFRPRQHNTSFLLTSKDDLKYHGVSFPKQPKPFTLSFILFQYLHKTWYGFYQFPQLFQHRTRPTILTTDPKVYKHSPDKYIIDAPDPSKARNSKTYIPL